MTQPPEFPPPSGHQPLPAYGEQPPPPPYGQPYAQQPYYGQPQKSGTNGFAIASLIFGIIGGCLLGFIFGFVALSQIKKNGQKGRGMAIAGIVLSVLWLAGLITVGVVGALDDAKRDDTGTIKEGGKVSATDLKVGDCLNLDDLQGQTKVDQVPAVPCAKPHDGQVYATVELPGSDFPGTDRVQKLSGERCYAAVKTAAPKAARDPKVEIIYIHPLKFTWSTGNHSSTCIAATEDKRTGSILD